MLSEKRKNELISFTSSIGLNLKNLDLLNSALTHGSYLKESNKNDLASNERLEFFGDSVLRLYVSEYLMIKYPYYLEGELSSLRAYVVSEKVLENIAKKLHLNKYILLGKNEKKITPKSILADAVEALLAVIYYECGHKVVKEFILDHWLNYIELASKDKEKENFKAVLQEYTQGKKLGLPIYKTISEKGPDHIKEFEVAVFLDLDELGRGTGSTKKVASQNAAKSALVYLRKSKKKD